MAYISIIVMLVLLEYLYFSVAVVRARTRHGVSAPAVTGDEQFERFHRAHQNTMEQIVVFVPAIYGAAYYSNVWLAGIAGVVFLLARAYYFKSYIVEPAERSVGMILTLVSNVVLIIATIVGALRVVLS